MVYPCFGIVFAQAITSFSLTDRRQLRFEGDRNALWLFVIALGSTLAIACQNYFFSTAAAGLTSKLRSLSFRAILRQDSALLDFRVDLILNFYLLVGWFDEDKNSTGGLVSVLSDNPTKINGLAGVTLGACVAFCLNNPF